MIQVGFYQDGGSVIVNKANKEAIWKLVMAQQPLSGRVLDKKLQSLMRKKYDQWVRYKTGGIIKKKTPQRYFATAIILQMALIGDVLADQSGGGREVEKKLSQLIDRYDKHMYKLLYDAIVYIYKNFHNTMKADKKYKDRCDKINRHYAYYYSSTSAQIGTALAVVKTLFSKSSDSKKIHSDHKKLISIEKAFTHIINKKPKGAWRLIAFLADYGRVVKTIFPWYFKEMAGPDWNKSEIDYQVKKGLGSETGKKAIYDEMDKLYKKKNLIQKVFSTKKSRYKKAKGTVGQRQRDKATIDTYAAFDRITEENDHMFYRMKGISARGKDHGVDESAPWVRRARAAGVVLDNGPSMTTAFTLGLLQILYPHEETMLSAALAIFNFWHSHYTVLHSGIHTWHEIMVVADSYVGNFDFTTWKKVDRPRPRQWDFTYPRSNALKVWLTASK